MASSQVGDMVNGNAEPTRHLAKFPPSLWGDRFTSFTLDKQLWDKYGNEIEVLKEQVRSMVVAGGRKAAEQINLINVLERLGVSYHFEKEIEEQLEQLFAKFEDNEDYDLFTIALHFRIFRQHGYKMSCDVFNKFRDSNGEFKETVSNDVQGMLSLYEATYLKIRGEGFLDEAHAFTIAQLESLVGGPHLSSDLSEQVMHALKQSIHRGFPRLEAKHFISFYEKDASRNETLLRLAKLDFNQLQLSHREELCHIFRWWKELDLISKVPYARDRAVECFFWSTCAYYEPQHSVGRAVLTKIMLLLSVTDDTYDAYGTYDELKLYTNAVQRWDVSAMDELPDYMKALYRALLNVYDEVERDLAKQGRDYGVHHSKEAFKEIVRSYEIEAEWFKEGYVASFEEYMKNALVTSTGRLHTTSCFMGLEADVATTEAFEWILTKPKMVAASGAIGRLVDDVMSHDEEQERGHVATGLDCYMKQRGVSKQEAIVELYKMIENAWRDINEEMLKPTAISMKLLIRVLNLSRISDVVYKYVDGYTHPEIIKDHVISLFEDPIPM
uniref:Valerianol synthase TPS1A n=1 Tax=Camellia hiemalis TaxID=1840584 RepID=TPS1A_CAMHI|nr:RecName: Full=Valerianol synthase TPS1A; AltName: Full=Terpene synthase 1; Short=ChTPS1; AltName: Full=Terpene synthase 1a; Short=ChTps1a [Camellia hiemalis]BBC44636.1 valerianol synthase [Camellia hiemalis]